MPAVIKNVNKESWKIFREESIRHGVTSGDMLNILVKEHMENEKGGKNTWDHILGRNKPLITKKEAEAIRKGADELRRGFKMRI